MLNAAVDLITRIASRKRKTRRAKRMFIFWQILSFSCN